MKSILCSILSLLTLISQAQKNEMIPEDYVYSPNIKSVLLYPYLGSNEASKTLNPPIISLQEEKTLVLEFDDLNAAFEQYHLRIIHCDYLWKPSNLSEIEYLSEYNDLIINDYQVSNGTKVPYYHYKIALPKVLLSGNYLAIIWKGRNKNDLVLTKRFMVFENIIGVGGEVRQAQNPSKYKNSQQIDFELQYGNYRLMSPRDELKIIIRQNYRWDKTVKNLKAFNVNESESKLIFRFFNDENVFPAGNEFRFFDSRSTYTRGMYISQISRSNTDEMLLSTQQDRSQTAYIESNDFDGNYVVSNRESANSEVEADYIWMNFVLKYPALSESQQLYVNGSFNQWRCDETNVMKYDESSSSYFARILLKQGVYNYNFVSIDKQFPNQPNESLLEGNFSETQNTYEILIYHRPFTSRAEKLIGYHILDFNKRR